MARHSLGSIVALSSDISKWVFVTAISVAPMAVLTCSGLSSNAGSAVSASGGAVVVVVVDLVVDVLAPWLLPLVHPAVRMQTLAMASAAVSLRTSSPGCLLMSECEYSSGRHPVSGLFGSIAAASLPRFTATRRARPGLTVGSTLDGGPNWADGAR